MPLQQSRLIDHEPAGASTGVVPANALRYSLVRKGSAGVDDGFRISSNPLDHQQDQALPCADSGKIGQLARKSATDCNQDLNDQEGLAPDKSDKTENQ